MDASAKRQQRATSDADDVLIREELDRRNVFDKKHKKTLLRLLLQPEPCEGNQAWQRTRVVRETASEIARRMEFDEKHPHIYKTEKDRKQAYAVFNPAMVLEQYERSDLRPFDPGQ